MKKAPKTRFVPFQEEWDSKRFADAFSVLPNNTLSRAELSEEAGTVKNVHYGDVLIKYGEYLDAGKTDIPFIASEDLAERWKSAALQDGDVVMADTAEDTTAGKCSEIGNVRSDTIVSGLHTIPLHPMSKFSEGYLGYYMNSDAFHDQLIPLMQGTKVTSISKTYLADTELCFPHDSAEQAQIAQLLYSLDQMITSQQRKCEKLIALKAACLDKMFPKAGCDAPVLRVSGFSTPWNVMRIKGIITEKLSNGIINHPGNEDSSVRHINVTNMYTPDKIHVEDLTYSAYGDIAVERCNVEFGDIFMTRSSVKPEGIAEPNVLLDTGKYVFDDHLIRMKINRKENDPLFVKISLETPFLRRQFISRSKTAAFTTIGQDDIVDCFICLPELSEQTKIAALFSNIDSLITLHHRKLEKLLQLKQAMMHNMFV